METRNQSKDHYFIEQPVIAFSCRVMCKCGSCGSRKQTLSEWEKHTGCRSKKWKHSVKVKSTMLPLEKWVCNISCFIRGLYQVFLVNSVGWFWINSHSMSSITWISSLLPTSNLFPNVSPFWVWIHKLCFWVCLLLCPFYFVTMLYLFLIFYLT